MMSEYKSGIQELVYPKNDYALDFVWAPCGRRTNSSIVVDDSSDNPREELSIAGQK